MSKSEIMNKLNRTMNRAGLKLKKHSPEILVVTGLISGVTAAVMACKATPKANAILEEAKQKIDAIHTVAETSTDTETGEAYTEKDVKQALTITYAQTGLEIVKTYAPAIAVGTFATVCILSGHNILRKRHAATAAAYMTLDKNFKEYRNRLIDRFGAELDKELRFNVKAKEVEETVTNEDGTEVVVKKVVDEVDPSTVGDYVIFFDEWCLGFEKNNPEYNLLFLKQVLNHANEKLQSQGHLFYNELRDMLGAPRTPVGAVVGWIYDPSNPNIDSYVSFGNIFDPSNEKRRDFVNGREPAILLECNCDGPIFEMI